MRAIAAYLGPGEQDLEAEVRFDLFPQLLQRLAKKLLYLTAAQADYMRMLLFQPRFIIVLVPTVMHQVQFIHQAAGLEHLQRAIDRNTVELGVALLGHLVQPLGIQVFARLVDQVEQNLPLPGEPDSLLS